MRAQLQQLEAQHAAAQQQEQGLLQRVQGAEAALTAARAQQDLQSKAVAGERELILKQRAEADRRYAEQQRRHAEEQRRQAEEQRRAVEVLQRQQAQRQAEWERQQQQRQAQLTALTRCVHAFEARAICMPSF